MTHSFDPDFDPPPMKEQRVQFTVPDALKQIPPRILFFGGVLLSVLTLCTLGFVIMLFMVIR